MPDCQKNSYLFYFSFIFFNFIYLFLFLLFIFFLFFLFYFFFNLNYFICDGDRGRAQTKTVCWGCAETKTIKQYARLSKNPFFSRFFYFIFYLFSF